jgi:hypothetical protein
MIGAGNAVRITRTQQFRETGAAKAAFQNCQ